MLHKISREYWLVFFIFVVGFIIRLWSVLPYNTEIGFDQARDLFISTTIFRDHHIAVIGPTAGNNPTLHHGVAYWYYLVLPLILGKGNPMIAVIWNCLFNALTVVTLYFFAKDLFKSKKAGFVAAFITACSFYYVQFSGWLSNPTVTFFSLPLFFYGIWKYYQNKNWGLIIAAFFLGLTIQFELFFVYLIPTFLILWFILKPKWPSLKLFLVSLSTFLLVTSSMIATEVKFHFAGIKSILFAGQFVGGGREDLITALSNFVRNRWETFYLNLWPQEKNIGVLIGVFAVLYIVYEIFKNKKLRKVHLFLLVIFFSPAIMFILGQHNAPWFYIGRPSSAILISAYLISKIKAKIIVLGILVLILFGNLSASNDSKGKGQVLLEPDPASIVSDQIKVMDYTYISSNGDKFEINTLTNPLYVNAVWGYQYYWYSRSYGYMPTWTGGDQLYPYNTLSNVTGDEKYLYLIMDTTNRIPPQYRQEMIKWADKESKFIEEKTFGGLEVQKRILNAKNTGSKNTKIN